MTVADEEVDAGIVIKDGRYFAAMWCVDGGPAWDWMAALYRDPGGPWVFTSRVRIRHDVKVWDSEDRKRWSTWHIDSSLDEPEVMRGVSHAVASVAERGRRLHKLILRSDKAHEIAMAMRRESFMHFRDEPVEGGPG